VEWESPRFRRGNCCLGPRHEKFPGRKSARQMSPDPILNVRNVLLRSDVRLLIPFPHEKSRQGDNELPRNITLNEFFEWFKNFKHLVNCYSFVSRFRGLTRPFSDNFSPCLSCLSIGFILLSPSRSLYYIYYLLYS